MVLELSRKELKLGEGCFENGKEKRMGDFGGREESEMSGVVGSQLV